VTNSTQAVLPFDECAAHMDIKVEDVENWIVRVVSSECTYVPANRAAVTASTRDLFFCATSVDLFEFPPSAFTAACSVLSQGHAPAMRRQTRCLTVHLLVGDVGAARVRVFVKNRVVPLQSTKLQLSSTPNPCAACLTTHAKQSPVTRHTSHVTRNACCVTKRIIDASA
jgi:hypothetical protein